MSCLLITREQPQTLKVEGPEAGWGIWAAYTRNEVETKHGLTMSPSPQAPVWLPDPSANYSCGWKRVRADVRGTDLNVSRGNTCWCNFCTSLGLPGGTTVKNMPANAGDVGDAGLIPGWGRSPELGNGYPLQYSCLENTMDRRAWWATVHGVTRNRHSWEASEHTHTLH